MTNNGKSIVFLGASGAVGSKVLEQLLSINHISRLLSLGRRILDLPSDASVEQQAIDIADPNTYNQYIQDLDTAICTLGVGEPSKISKEDFVKIDKIAVLDFAKVCKQNGVKHFQLLASVGISPKSSNFFLRTKGELVEELEKLEFERLSIFQPSMILTPTNRYGTSQAFVLKVWPKLNFILRGDWKKYRGIRVDQLGKAIANNTFTQGKGLEYLQYDQFISLNHHEFQ